MTTLSTRLHGLAATLALVAFMAGVPAVLLAIAAIPDLGAFSWSRLTAPDDGSLALEVISAVCWAAWAVFTCQLIASIVSQIRGVRAPQLPGLVAPQLAADRLVAAAALLFVAVPTATALLPQPRAEAAVVSTPLPELERTATESGPPERPGSHAVPAKNEPTTERYTVKRGDSLWKIAEDRLGDGTRYVELVELNEAVLNGKPDFLQPGTVLKVPIIEADQQGTYVVQPGDTLSQIAEDQLGDADAYPSIFDASVGTVQANGTHLSDPDLILPGWKLTIPGQHQSDRQPRSDPPDDSREPPEDPKQATPTQPDVAAPTPDEGDGGADEADTDWTPGWMLPGLTGAGALLAGSLWLALRQHRRTQLRYRRPGTVIAPPPPELLAVEKSAHVTGSAVARRIEDLDAALRSLAPITPPLVTARLSNRTVTVTLASAADLPDPWTGSATEWSLDLDQVPEPDVDALPPYPLLVSIGQAPDGALVLVNLEQLRTTSVTGDAAQREAFARHITAELALNPWCLLATVDVLGLGGELTTIDPGRVRAHPADDTAVIDRLTRDLASDSPDTEPDQFRAVIIAGHDRPQADVEALAVALTDFPGRPAAALVDLLSSAGRTELNIAPDGRLTSPALGLDLAASGLTSDEAAACARLVDITRDATVTPLPQPDDEAAVADPGGALVDRLTEPRPEGPAGSGSLLPLGANVYADGGATTPADVEALAPIAADKAAPRVTTSDPDLDEDLARWESPLPVAPKLTLLGPVSARTLGDATATSNRRPYYVELLAYLALHPNGVTAEDIADAVGIRPKRARTDMSAVRLWLGSDHDGQPFLPPARQTHANGVAAPYRLRDVLCDLDLFRRLRVRGQSRGADGIDDLVAALRLVSGEPFTGLRENGWSWLLEGERLDHVMAAAIVDVAHIVTAHALSVDDHNLAVLATRTALAASPYDETARLDAVAVAKATGNDDEASILLVNGILDRTDDELGPIDPPERTTTIINGHGWSTTPAPRRKSG